jgi:hypothetical protein
MPIMRSRSERATISATLGIVGAHFLVMLPAFGPLIGGWASAARSTPQRSGAFRPIGRALLGL